ncbi:SH3 domain-containing protein [Streptomyces sp. NPDC049949]|uniref:SH3 domain-containing protein n=1 Tax=Streptomyces sp. NPDC049949 TaxID=3154627 RepID=UPI00341C9EF0
MACQGGPIPPAVTGRVSRSSNFVERPISATLLALAPLAAVSAPAGAVAASDPVAVAEWNSCGYQVTTNVKLRTGPTMKHTSIGVLTPKDSVYVLREKNGFYEIELHGGSETGLKWGTKGWIIKHVKPHVCMTLDG